MKDDIRPTRQAKTVAAALKKNIFSNNPTEPVTQGVDLSVSSLPAVAGNVRLHKRVHWWLKNLSREQLIVLAIATGMVLVGAVYVSRALLQGNPVTEPAALSVNPGPKEPPAPTTVASRMTGMQVAPELAQLPATGVIIENSPEARPQAGLLQADMVYEAISEGGITRFLALYQESQPDYIGPVRSARSQFLDFLVPYDAPLAHAGGSPEALAQIKSQGIKDLDHGGNGATYQRVSNRYAPHNLYTSRAKLLELQNKKGYTSSTYKGLARKEEDSPATAVTARAIDFSVSSFLYNPRFDYDPATNNYKRSEGGKPHVDERSGTQIAPKVVVALVMAHRYAGIYSVYQNHGSGDAVIFQDGVAIPARWEKANRSSELILKDTAGAVLPLNPGQTWFTLVSTAGAIKYVP